MISTLAYFGIDTKWEMLTFIMVLIFLLGFPFEWIEICLIVLPVFGPILVKYDFSDHIGNNAALMTWFGTLVAVNLQTAFMTPPFGATLFYMKGTAPPGVTMSDVFKAMYPFVALQVVGLMLCIYFPSISLWLPQAGRLPRIGPGKTKGRLAAPLSFPVMRGNSLDVVRSASGRTRTWR